MKLRLYTVISLLFFAGLLHAQTQNCLDFDGVDDNVTVPGASTLISGYNHMSISCWVNPANTNITFPDYDGFIGFRNNTDADFYIVQLSNTGIEARFRNSTGTNYDVVFSGLIANVWQHFVFTYDGDFINLYHNDVLVGATPASGSIANQSSPFLIGNLPYSSFNYYLSGKLDEVSLWGKSLTPQDVHCMYISGINPTATDLLLYYNFNQGLAGGNNTGLNTLSATAGNLNGTLNNFLLFSSASNWVDGVLGATLVNATICSGQSYPFGSQTLSTAGTYTEVFPTTSGCDSTVTLTLSVNTFDLSVSLASVTLTAGQAGGTYQWLNCNNNYAVIPNATGQSYTATANGNYAAKITYNGCTDTTVCQAVTTVGIEEGSFGQGVQVYPVPFQNSLKLDMGVVYNELSLRITDLYGKVIFEGLYQNTQQLEYKAGNESAGLYFLDVRAGGRHFRMKVVKD